MSPREKLSADIRNGEAFEGNTLVYFEGRIARAEWRIGDAAQAFESRAGDLPALTLTAPDRSDLLTLVYEAKPQSLTYKNWELFARFVSHKDLGDTLERHFARGFNEDHVREVYSRFCKSLVSVGDGAGADRAVGLETEIVLLDNPFTTEGDTLRAKVIYREMDRIGAQIEVFEKDASGTVTVFTTRTDDTGVATIPVKSGHSYLLDAVVMRQPAPDRAEAFNAQWESLWASLTFARP